MKNNNTESSITSGDYQAEDPGLRIDTRTSLSGVDHNSGSFASSSRQSEYTKYQSSKRSITVAEDKDKEVTTNRKKSWREVLCCCRRSKIEEKAF
jgi:hypothetical protein